MANSVSTQPASGFRDFIQQQASLRAHLMNQIANVYSSFGFQALETPALENLEVLLGSGGQDNEKLIFKCLKRGEKLESVLAAASSSNVLAEKDLTDLGLRFDLTVPLCRVVAEYQNEIKLPWKAFHMGPVWRAERAQKGRYREFMQCDVDVIGSSSLSAELEVIQAVVAAFSALEIKDLILRLNHRGLIEALAKKFGFEDQKEIFAITLDKKDKMPIDKLMREFEKINASSANSTLQSFLQKGLSFEEAQSLDPQAAKDLEYLLKHLEALKLDLKAIHFDASLVRGMGYYTGCVFEIFHESAGYALGGGGRYDELIGRFTSKPIPAVGFSIGFERLILFLEENGKAQEKNSRRIFLPVFSEDLRIQALQLAQKIRKLGFFVDVYADEAKLQKQLKYASANHYRWVLLAGESEFSSGELKLKDFESGTDQSFSIDSLKEFLS